MTNERGGAGGGRIDPDVGISRKKGSAHAHAQ